MINSPECAQYLLECGVFVCPNMYKESPYDIALKHGSDSEIVRRVFVCPNMYKESPYDIALKHGSDSEIVRVFLYDPNLLIKMPDESL